MKRLMNLVATLWVTLLMCFAGNALAQSNALDPAEAESLEFLLLFAEMKQSYYEKMGKHWEGPTFTEIAAEEQRDHEKLKSLAAHYAIEVSDIGLSCNIVLMELEELEFYCGFVTQTPWWDEWEAAAAAAAYLEELGIRELTEALQDTDEQMLTYAYADILDAAYVHLLKFAAMLHGDPFDYVAQLIDQAEVDEALTAAAGTLPEEFEINSGLNDAWYDPATRGQGFTVSVFEDKGIVSLTWFTYDTELPPPDASANLGAPGQRWLVAQGDYEGSQAEMVVYSSSGGLFDMSQPVPEFDQIGSITLQFEDCYTGTVIYQLPAIGRSGSIPIQRVALDNVCNCEDVAYAVR